MSLSLQKQVSGLHGLRWRQNVGATERRSPGQSGNSLLIATQVAKDIG